MIIDALIGPFSAGFQVLIKDIRVVFLVCMYSVFPFGLLAILLLYRLKVTQNLAALLSGGLCGGILLDILVSFPVIALAPQKHVAVLLTITIISMVVIAVALWHTCNFSPKITVHFYGLITLSLAILICKLAFIYSLDLPQYSDSIEHYTIIQDLASKDVTPRSYYNLRSFPDVYYHYDYHVILAKLDLLTHANLANLMLIYGQLALAISAIGLYFPIYLLTRNQMAGFLGVLTAGFVLVMPGYAINWGKYPAIIAFATFPFVLGLIIAANQRKWQKIGVGYYATIVINLLFCFLVHTRMAVIFIIVFIVLIVSTKIQMKPWKLSIACLAMLIPLCFLMITKNTFVNSLFEIYWRDGITPLILALLSCVICIIQKPRLAMPVLLFLILFSLATTITLPSRFENRGSLVDRPFFQIGAFLPIAMIIGVGFSSLLEIPGLITRPMLQCGGFGIILTSLLIGAPWDILLYPSECCRLSTDEDLYAYHWIQSNSSLRDKFLIAAFSTPYALFESDGGGWIENITNRPVAKVASDYNFGSKNNKNSLCSQGVQFIYVGSHSYSFDHDLLSQFPYWYKSEFGTQGVKIYRILCEISSNSGT